MVWQSNIALFFNIASIEFNALIPLGRKPWPCKIKARILTLQPRPYIYLNVSVTWKSTSPQVLFTARCYASAVLAMGLCPSVSVSVSVTSRCSTKTAKHRITQTTPHDTLGTLVFWRQRSPRNSTGVTPTRAPNAGGVGQNRRLSTNKRLYLENGKR